MTKVQLLCLKLVQLTTFPVAFPGALINRNDNVTMSMVLIETRNLATQSKSKVLAWENSANLNYPLFIYLCSSACPHVLALK